MNKQELILSGVNSGRVAIELRGKVQFVWNVPKEFFGWKVTMSSSPIVQNKIFKTLFDLTLYLDESDENWKVLTDYKECENEESE